MPQGLPQETDFFYQVITSLGKISKPFKVCHFSPSVLLTTPNYGVSRRLWYYQVFKVRLFLICCLLSYVCCVAIHLLYFYYTTLHPKRYTFLKKIFCRRSTLVIPTAEQAKIFSNVESCQLKIQQPINSYKWLDFNVFASSGTFFVPWFYEFLWKN